MLRIQVCPQKGIPLLSYSGDGIETINPTLGRGLDSWGGLIEITVGIGFFGQFEATCPVQFAIYHRLDVDQILNLVLSR